MDVATVMAMDTDINHQPATVLPQAGGDMVMVMDTDTEATWLQR